MTAPAYWAQAIKELRKKDKILKAIIDGYKGETITMRGDAFFTLARSITGQQISVKAADSVWNRLAAAAQPMTAKTIANTDATILRACGLSASKVIYLHALANHFLENKQQIKHWPEMEDNEVIKELTSIHGIGQWTAEMFLIFNLARPDIFPLGDIGLLKAIFRHYNQGEKMPLGDVRAQGELWKPWRTVATWYLWRSLDPVPVEY